MKKLFSLFLLVVSIQSFAIEKYFCTTDIESLPTLNGGRVKPFYSLATENLKYITGKSNPIKELGPVSLYCLLSSASQGVRQDIKLPLRVDHQDVKKLLGIKGGEIYLASQALENADLIRSELMGLKENNSYKKDLQKVFNRIQLYADVIAGTNWTLPKYVAGKIQFLPAVQMLSQAEVEAGTQVRGKEIFNDYFKNIKNTYIKMEGDDYLLELTYKKSKLFSWAMLLVLLSVFAGVIFKNNKLFYVLSSITVLSQIAGMTMRILISGRAPITNMYETVMFSGLGALIIGIGISLFKKDKNYTIGGLCYNLLCLMMMTFANDMLDESISPLVPVLRDNFWLSTHVTTIILSYAALALSWVLANIVLVKRLTGRTDAKSDRADEKLIYTCLKFGTVLLAAGIILGGVWADYSWGRFWGWDPKETWSLIVLLVYMAILHGKYTNWINPRAFVTLVAAAFMSVMMAWFGVNYILASGLHSYGFSEGGAIFLGSFFAIQTGFLIISSIKTKIVST